MDFILIMTVMSPIIPELIFQHNIPVSGLDLSIYQLGLCHPQASQIQIMVMVGQATLTIEFKLVLQVKG